MAETFGHYNIFATLSLSLSLSLSQVLAYKRGNNTFLFYARVARARIYGFSCNGAREAGLFFCPRRTTVAGTATDAYNNKQF